MTTSLRALVIVGLAALAGGIHASASSIEVRPLHEPDSPAASAHGGLSLEDARRSFDDPTVVFVDASRPDEFRDGHIPGAVNVPLGAFAGGRVPDVIDYFDREAAIVVYCPTETCDAARRVAEFLRALGYARVEVFHAGFKAWRGAGFPVE